MRFIITKAKSGFTRRHFESWIEDFAYVIYCSLLQGATTAEMKEEQENFMRVLLHLLAAFGVAK